MTTYRDRVRETTQSTGTGAYLLEGAAAGHQSFLEAFGAVAGVIYAVTDGADWEVGIGTLSAGPNVLTRDTILASSNGGADVVWGVGVKDIFHVIPAVEAEKIGTVEVSDDGGSTSTPVRILSFEAGLTLNVAGDVAEIDADTGGGAGPSGGTLQGGAEMLYEADVGIGVANGAAVNTWADQSGNGYDLTEATNPPTFRSADAEDGLPYVEFDGVNDLLEAIRTAGLYAGEACTIYFVYRVNAQGGNTGVACFSENGENMSSGTRPFWQADTSGRITLTYAGAGYNNGTGEHLRTTVWQVAAFRSSIRMGRGIITVVDGGLHRHADLGAGSASLPDLDFDRFRLGAQYNNFGGAGNFARCDLRAMAVYLTDHSESEMRSMLGYLRDKWAADLLAHNP